MKRVALAALFLVAACGSIGAQAKSISLAYKAGDTYKYGLHVVMKYTIAASGMSIPFDLDLSAKEKVTVKSVDSSGAADLAVAITNVSVKTTMGGTTNTTTTNTGATIEMKVAKDGEILSVNGSAFGSSRALPGMTGTQGGIVSAILPDHPVKPGDKWTKSYDVPGLLGSGSLHATSNNTYLRDENVGSVNAAVIDSKADTSLDMTIDASSILGASAAPSPSESGSVAMKGASKSDTTSWIDVGGHRILKTHSTGSVDATVTVNATPPPNASVPTITGPVTLKGTQTLDLTPA